MARIFVTAVLSYLVGSIPFGYILIRIFQGKDIRTTGSGNIGATNVARSSGFLGILTLLLDATKGLAAVALTRSLWPGQAQLGALAALFAILGHVFPAWLGFRGGKGVATALGAFLPLAPKALLITLTIFAVVLAVFRYVSLASVISVGVFPAISWAFSASSMSLMVLGVIAAASIVIIARHEGN
ncbi:MAG: glycerol-3-phosphate 1-O-acyltransferase PlsY, partial [Acidobacteriales bacterium]|nr:glycerol-3-phosphate 1-O-acyltransferase PlsY [Terriglobales bacterium]